MNGTPPDRNGGLLPRPIGFKIPSGGWGRIDVLLQKVSEESPRKSSNGQNNNNRTKTDTGRQVEYTKALGRILLKELCKMTPYVRNKGCLLVC